MIGDVILKQGAQWLHFTRPRLIIATRELSEVGKKLKEVEQAVDQSGWIAVGFISYEAAPAFDSALRAIPSNDFPLLWFGLYDSHQTLRELEHRKASPTPLVWQPDTEKDVYNASIQTIKNHIAMGRTYQVNYTMRLSSRVQADSSGEIDQHAWQLFSHLSAMQNKYAAYVDIGDWAICSASHELFFELDGNTITSRPMKGTVKRGRNLTEDTQISTWLRENPKNRAENVMIVDMIRNDIGRIAEVGSIQVSELFAIEKYPTLFQMTSTVQAKTRSSVTEIFSALFPCASITGAPKVSTMNIIAELETSPRKVYCGSIGYIAPNRKARFNVAIRTALVDKRNGNAEFGIGGGIVWDSTSIDEYDEALLKARVLTDPPQTEFSLFETLLWTPEGGYFLLDRHIERLLNSAEYFGFTPVGQAFSLTYSGTQMNGGLETHTTISQHQIIEILNDLIAEATSPKRVKLLMTSQGEFSGEVKDFQPKDKIFQVCLAKKPVNSNDRFLFHKTTNRGAYDNALIEGYDDTLLFNEKGELTEFTIGNLVVKMNGELFTPPVECGLLAGTFRAELIASGEVKERVLHIQDMAKFEALFLVNSLRKWTQIKLS